jgi:hypothetical protein
MHRFRNVLVAAGGVALLAASFAAPAADVDPPLPLTVKQRLIELTEAPTTASRGRCVNGEAMRALISAAPAYADEIAVFATRRLQERAPRADEDCSCLIELTKAIGSAMPERAASFSRLVAGQAPACGGLLIRGIDDSQAGNGAMVMEGRPAGGGAVARSACVASRACATPLLRPRSDLIGPTRLGGDS